MMEAIVWKEIRETIRDRNMLSSILSISLLMILLNLTSFKLLIANTETFIAYMAPCIGVLVGFSLGYRFTREKMEGVLETLLCTPLTLKELWLGKVIGLTIPSYATSVVIVLILTLMRGLTIGGAMLAYILLALPMFIASVIGLLGYLQYILGMKQIQALNFVVFFTLFATLHMVIRRLPHENTVITWSNVRAAITFTSAILATTYYLVTRLSKEKVILEIS